MTEPQSEMTGDARDARRRFPWWVYVVLVLAVIVGALIAFARGDGDVTPLTVMLVIVGAVALVALRVVLRRGACALGSGLRRRGDN